MTLRRAWTALALCLAPAVARAAEPAAPTFEKDVQPILKAKCVTCHSGDAPKAKLDLSTRAKLIAGGKTGPAVKPGSLKDSPLWLNVSTDKMPATGAKLTEAEKDVLRRWVQAGAPGDGVAAIKPSTPGTAPSAPVTKRGVAATAKAVDDVIDSRLAKEKVKAAPAADDAEFLRRAYLDLTGVIPTADKAAAFLDSKEPDKRAKLIDALLDSPEFGKFAASQWAALITVDEPALRAKFEPWLADQFNKNRGWDALVRDLITATGTGPETTFVLSNVDNKKPVPEKVAGATARLFLGIQLQCAECHNHPFTEWKQTDFWALAAFFSRTQVSNKPPAGLGEAETTIIRVNPPKGVKLPPDTFAGSVIPIAATAGTAAGTPVRAKFLQGSAPELDAKGPFRPALAAWVTAADNPFFAQAHVNRVWAHFFGPGLVNPVDDLSPENAPTQPDVLRVLAAEFQTSGFDRKHLIRTITATKAYQRTNKGGIPPAELHLYARVPVKVMPPDALYDSLVRATGLKEITLNAYLPTAGRGGVTAKVPPRDAFVRFFSTRELGTAGTEYSHGIPQALALLNVPALNKPTPAVQQLVKDKVPAEQAVERLYLAALARRPTPDEVKVMADFLAKRPDPADGYAGVLWILLNTPEFVLTR
jgi:hypothetical protein